MCGKDEDCGYLPWGEDGLAIVGRGEVEFWGSEVDMAMEGDENRVAGGDEGRLFRRSAWDPGSGLCPLHLLSNGSPHSCSSGHCPHHQGHADGTRQSWDPLCASCPRLGFSPAPPPARSPASVERYFEGDVEPETGPVWWRLKPKGDRPEKWRRRFENGQPHSRRGDPFSFTEHAGDGIDFFG